MTATCQKPQVHPSTSVVGLFETKRGQFSRWETVRSRPGGGLVSILSSGSSGTLDERDDERDGWDDFFFFFFLFFFFLFFFSLFSSFSKYASRCSSWNLVGKRTRRWLSLCNRRGRLWILVDKWAARGNYCLI
ncbi:hypothetical protein SODALDRAFT_176467 [Sodiomyces alkalinus F11]|uniref:Uncharacterized protein n=1 Tax=Sodiomyces alkalinus (strain CBS 110278 / VKM F-3762 / F11) TaxID=1314773 RepID=A0A3N2PTW9_SODAK|nr:hypothetical protein SODALDRAFT_176467 [Sodiomyces alkalinus F11]ROT37894.1 hypothetical protein SODALDRAFT_176467 [Sodiomyces alkalinus F11]